MFTSLLNVGWKQLISLLILCLAVISNQTIFVSSATCQLDSFLCNFNLLSWLTTCVKYTSNVDISFDTSTSCLKSVDGKLSVCCGILSGSNDLTVGSYSCTSTSKVTIGNPTFSKDSSWNIKSNGKADIGCYIQGGATSSTPLVNINAEGLISVDSFELQRFPESFNDRICYYTRVVSNSSSIEFLPGRGVSCQYLEEINAFYNVSMNLTVIGDLQSEGSVGAKIITGEDGYCDVTLSENGGFYSDSVSCGKGLSFLSYGRDTTVKITNNVEVRKFGEISFTTKQVPVVVDPSSIATPSPTKSSPRSSITIGGNVICGDNESKCDVKFNGFHEIKTSGDMNSNNNITITNVESFEVSSVTHVGGSLFIVWNTTGTTISGCPTKSQIKVVFGKGLEISGNLIFVAGDLFCPIQCQVSGNFQVNGVVEKSGPVSLVVNGKEYSNFVDKTPPLPDGSIAGIVVGSLSAVLLLVVVTVKRKAIAARWKKFVSNEGRNQYIVYDPALEHRLSITSLSRYPGLPIPAIFLELGNGEDQAIPVEGDDDERSRIPSAIVRAAPAG